MKNMVTTLIVTNLVGVHPRNIHPKFEANPCRRSRKTKKVHAATADNGHRVIARVTHWLSVTKNTTLGVISV